jgi:hypothetical protein
MKQRRTARHGPKNQLTIRGLDPRVAAEIERVARMEGVSLNRAAVGLLRKGAGVAIGQDDANQIGQSLDHLFGTWSRDQADKLLESIRSCEQVDGDFWQ